MYEYAKHNLNKRNSMEIPISKNNPFFSRFVMEKYFVIPFVTCSELKSRSFSHYLKGKGNMYMSRIDQLGSLLDMYYISISSPCSYLRAYVTTCIWECFIQSVGQS